ESPGPRRRAGACATRWRLSSVLLWGQGGQDRQDGLEGSLAPLPAHPAHPAHPAVLMFRILDRYVVREVLLPFFLGLLVITFLLLMPPILDYGERLIAKGVDWITIARILATLVPQALGVSIPMALLLGILMGLGRLSADREFVAL